ncbi:bile acid:sodium symporter family protein [Qipengyuania sp. MTN3-11]|uniref:bile acid:sodium symporter family protein n=1 Tax=Qipengyuania sp. MTN3-11 TaxID=3056557 RepID=UPI0036F31F08
MMIRSVLSDPMLRMLAGAIALAAILPATGAGRVAAEWVVNAAIFTLFLLNGMRIARSDIAAGLANWRFLLPLVLWVFGAMALAGLGLARIGEGVLPPLVAVGFLYLGALPSTVQSATSYTSLAGGNIALSVVGAALLNILGVFVTVPIFLALGGSGEGAVGFETVRKIALILLLPFAIGQLVQGWTTGFIARHKPKIVWIDRFVIAIAVYVAFSGAVEQGIWSRVDAAAWAVLSGLVALFLLVGNLGAWIVGGMLALPRRDRIAFLFGGAQKSAAIGVPLATILFAPEAAGFIVVPLLLYHLFQLVVAAPVAGRLRVRPAAAELPPQATARSG